MEETAKGIPPVDNKASRFGNPAFRTFYDKVTEVNNTRSVTCLETNVPDSFPRTSMLHFPDYRLMRSQRSPRTSVNHGETELV